MNKPTISIQRDWKLDYKDGNMGEWKMAYDCNSHKFYHGLHASRARMNVVSVEINGTLNTNPVIIGNCVECFTNLFGQDKRLITKKKLMLKWLPIMCSLLC